MTPSPESDASEGGDARGLGWGWRGGAETEIEMGTEEEDTVTCRVVHGVVVAIEMEAETKTETETEIEMGTEETRRVWGGAPQQQGTYEVNTVPEGLHAEVVEQMIHEWLPVSKRRTLRERGGRRRLGGRNGSVRGGGDHGLQVAPAEVVLQKSVRVRCVVRGFPHPRENLGGAPLAQALVGWNPATAPPTDPARVVDIDRVNFVLAFARYEENELLPAKRLGGERDDGLPFAPPIEVPLPLHAVPARIEANERSLG